MYSRLQVIKKYLHYYYHASNGKGHGIHSPFVFNFIKQVLNDNNSYEVYERVEALRRRMLADQTILEVEDLGAGSAIAHSRQRKIADIARFAAKPKKLGQLLFRIAHYYKPQTILEMGTSLGITTSYLALGNPSAKVTTLEGAAQVASMAKKNFAALGLTNTDLRVGNFNDTLPAIIAGPDKPLLVFIDGNHNKNPTLDYFNQLAPGINPSAILIFDDIHWSRDMEEAWEIIRCHKQVKVSIDLFFMGLVFFREEIREKQHYTIRF
jgi:predicted O-methyltransferase YrrM